MKPNTYELAAIAAALPSGLPAERVQFALAIWEAAEAAAHPQRDSTLQPLDELLAELMPKREPGHRFKRWHDFLTWYEIDKLLTRQSVAYALTKSPQKQLEMRQEALEEAPKLADMAADMTMAKHRKNGVPNRIKMAESFRRWDKDKTSQAYSERAKTAADARHSKKKKFDTINEAEIPSKETSSNRKRVSAPSKQEASKQKRKK